MKIEFKKNENKIWMAYFSECPHISGSWRLNDILEQAGWAAGARYLRPIVMREWLKQGKSLHIAWKPQ